jgi:hypothetical protein
MAVKISNNNLKQAKNAKKDEFYNQLSKLASPIEKTYYKVDNDFFLQLYA